MQKIQSAFAAFLVVLNFGALAAGDKPAENARAFGATDIEVRLKDGSIIRGQAQGLESISLKMPYGTLTFPAADIYSVTTGERITGEAAKEVVELIKGLDDDNFTKRAEAQKRLEGIGIGASDILKQERVN